jgi:hypothetical protein
MFERNPWINSRLPPGAAASLAALHMADPRPKTLASLSDRDWREALDFCDRSQLTLSLRDAARDAMPAWVQERTDRDAAKNLKRLRITEDLCRTLQSTLKPLDFLALKGLAQCPDFIPRPESRVQYDIDLFVPRPDLTAARDAILSLGFESFEEMEPFPTDHIPPLIRKTGWEWRGDFFDPEIPLSIELHFQFWNPELEKLPVADVEQFWPRRTTRQIAGVPFQVLHRGDALGYSSLHLLKHFFRGSARPFHVYELASFLHSHARDDAFWTEWRSLHSAAFRRLEAVVFRLAAGWFGCALGAIAAAEVADLPKGTAAWFAGAGAEGLFGTSKQELWLHLSLLDSRRDSWSVIRRRLLPGRLPGAVDAVHIPERDLTFRRRLIKQARYTAYLASRLRHHSATLPRVAWAGLAWWWKTRHK